MIPKSLSRWPSVLLAVLAAALVAGCQSTRSEREAASADFSRRSDPLYYAYLNSDAPHARLELLQLLQLVESEKKLSPLADATYKTRVYGWLFAFEKRVGNPDIAEVYFAKARYWKIRWAELSGQTDAGIAAILKGFTEDQALAAVDEWDKAHTNGRGPLYLYQMTLPLGTNAPVFVPPIR